MVPQRWVPGHTYPLCENLGYALTNLIYPINMKVRMEQNDDAV